jgi:hypothetical protein
MKNLLISAFSGYDEVSKVSDIVHSWNAVKKEGDEFIIATAGEKTVCHEFLEDQGVELRWMDTTGHPYHHRFSWYDKIITGEGDGATNVLCVDIRDVVFQYNPFDWLKHHRKKNIVVCDEGICHDEEWNGFMLKQAFRHDAPDLPVLNCGVIGGSPAEVSDICHSIVKMTSNLPESAMHEGQNVMVIADQAAYSLLLKDKKEQKVGNDVNWCLTMGTASSTLKEMRVVKGQFVNRGGEAYAIVHQYDRHEVLSYDPAHNTFYAQNENEPPVENFVFQSPSSPSP